MVCAVCGGGLKGDGVKVIKHCNKIPSEVVKESGREAGYGVMTCEEQGWTEEQHRWYEEFVMGLVGGRDSSCL